jgi:hypothetical protein
MINDLVVLEGYGINWEKNYWLSVKKFPYTGVRMENSLYEKR